MAAKYSRTLPPLLQWYRSIPYLVSPVFDHDSVVLYKLRRRIKIKIKFEIRFRK